MAHDQKVAGAPVGQAPSTREGQRKLCDTLERITLLEKEIASLEAVRSSLDVQREEAVHSLATIRAERQSLATQVAETKRALEALETEIKAVETKRDILATVCRRTEERAESRRRELERLSAEQLLRRDEARAATAALTEIQGAMARMERKLARAREKP